jgi:(S)-mandelate dehydrogenase
MSKATDRAISIEDLRAIARRRLPRFAFDYIDGGADDEVTLRANRQSFERLRFQPRALVDVSQRSVAATILGRPASMPVIAGPVGLLGLFWRDGDLEAARAAKAAGIPCAVSTVSMSYLEDIARVAGGHLWFQCYVLKEWALTKTLIRRAADAGYETLIITSDVPIAGNRERELQSGMRPTGKLKWGSKLESLRHPHWLATVATRRPTFVNIDRELGPDRRRREFFATGMFDPALNWDDFRNIRDLWRGKLLLKGILRPDDAERAVAMGADGLVLSNHGGRQLDGAIPAMQALPHVMRAVSGRASVMIDGGVRRGADIAKAIALGAEAVIVGRAIGYGLAAGGAAGVKRALDILQAGLDRTLALTGSRRLEDLSPDLIASD